MNQQQLLEKQKKLLETFENESKTISIEINGIMQLTKLNIKTNTEIQLIEQELPKLINKGYISIAIKIQELIKEIQK